MTKLQTNESRWLEKVTCHTNSGPLWDYSLFFKVCHPCSCLDLFIHTSTLYSSAPLMHNRDHMCITQARAYFINKVFPLTILSYLMCYHITAHWQYVGLKYECQAVLSWHEVLSETIYIQTNYCLIQNKQTSIKKKEWCFCRSTNEKTRISSNQISITQMIKDSEWHLSSAGCGK